MNALTGRHIGSLRIEVVRFPFEPQPLRPYCPRMCAKNVKTEQLAPADIL